MKETTFYVLIKAERSIYGSKPITRIKVTKMTKGKPAVPRGEIAVGVRLKVPEEIFEEWTPIINLVVEPRFITPPVLDGILSGLLEKS